MKNLVWRLKMVFYIFMYLVMSYKIGKLFLDFSIMENNSILHQVKLWKITLSHSMLNKKSWKITFQFILKLLPTKQKNKNMKESSIKKKFLYFQKKMLMQRQKHCCPGNFSNTHLQTGPTKKQKKKKRRAKLGDTFEVGPTATTLCISPTSFYIWFIGWDPKPKAIDTCPTISHNKPAEKSFSLLHS